MIVIAGTFDVDPADRDKFLEAAKAVMADTVKEDGCHAYCFSPDINEPNIVHLFEQWESEGHLGPHMKSDHIKTFGRAMREIKMNGRSITMFEVASSKSM